MDTPIEEGTIKEIDGRRRVFYDGYWIKVYDPPADSLRAKKALIEALTRRLFNHVEHGINVPGRRLAEARKGYEDETDPARKRVKGAMLAGALFNRATDIFTKMVELQELGIEIQTDNALMRECGHCLRESLDLGRLVHHRSGEEGIDELWGEPFRAFSIPVEAFYESRYIKIAQTMRDIDRIANGLVSSLPPSGLFHGIDTLIHAYARAARVKCETLRTDPAIFEVWTDFAVAGQALLAYTPDLSFAAHPERHHQVADGMQLLISGRHLIDYISRARTPMPKSTREFLARCECYATHTLPLTGHLRVAQ